MQVGHLRDTIWFVLDLNTMGEDISNIGSIALQEDNVLKAFGEVFANSLESTSGCYLLECLEIKILSFIIFGQFLV